MIRITIGFIFIIFFSSNSLANKNICGTKKNITFYNETDEYYNMIGPEKYLSELESILKNFGIVTNNFENNGQNELIFKDNGDLISTNLATCEQEVLQWEYQYTPYESTFMILAGENDTEEYLLKFGFEGSNFYSDQYFYKVVFYQQGLQDCHNEMNPICHKFLTELEIIGYSNLKTNLTYTEQKEILIAKIEEERKAKEEEERRLLAEKKAEEERIKKERIEREKYEKELAEKQRLEQERAYKEAEEFNNSAYGQLFNSYKTYLIIRELYEARKDYAIQYITYSKMSDIKKQVREIENKIKSSNNINDEEIWSAASESFNSETSGYLDILKFTGTYNNQIDAYTKLQLMYFNGLYEDILGPRSLEKDF